MEREGRNGREWRREKDRGRSLEEKICPLNLDDHICGDILFVLA